MKRNLLIIVGSALLLLLTQQGIGQTKKETEDWILYYMRKNFYRDNGGTIVGKYGHGFSQDKEAYFLRQYKFAGNKLIVDMQLKEYSGKEIFDVTTTIDLTKVVKVEKTTVIDTLINKYPSKYSYSGTYTKVEFVFPKLEYISETRVKGPLPVITHDNNKNSGYASNSFIIIDTDDKDILQNGIIDRLIKAFETLVRLNNGKILKEVF